MPDDFLTLFLLVFLAMFVIAVIYKSFKIKNEEKEMADDKLEEVAREQDIDLERRIKAVITRTLKLIADNKDDEEIVFFLKAFVSGYPYITRLMAIEQHYENRHSYSWDIAANDRFGDKVLEKLTDYEPPKYFNIATIVDQNTLQLYQQLVQQFLHMNVEPPPMHKSNYILDLSNRYFYYTRVNDWRIPHFVNSDNKHVFIYPTSIIVQYNDTEFERISLREANIQFQQIDTGAIQTGVITINKANLIVTTKNIDAADKFFHIYKKIQSSYKFVKNEKSDNNNSEIHQADISSILERMNTLTGLKQAKADFVAVANYIKIQQLRKSKGLKSQTQAYHCVFTGNPGTGKTTLARLLADVYRELGVVQSGHLVEVDRSKLVGEYVGQTAVKTNELIDKALDGVLFIDEAYSLVQGNQDDFGNEAIATLLKRMEDDRDRLVVILAGYNDEMKKFIDSNPGLQSRFTRYLHFDDYTAPELMEIFCKMAASNDYELDNEARNRLHQILQNAVDTKTKNFGNARYVRNLFEKTIERQASRLTANQSPTENDLRTIKEDDIKEL